MTYFLSVLTAVIVYGILSVMDKGEDYFRGSTSSLIIFLFLLGISSLLWRLVWVIIEG